MRRSETYKEERSLRERLEALEDRERDKYPSKPFKIPMKGRVGNAKIKKGFVTVVTIADNKNVDFAKERIIDGTIKLQQGDLSFHAIDPEDIFFYKGKPLLFQPKRKLNPYNPLKGKHETYGQKYVMARMEGDKIALKKSIGWGMGIGVLVLVGIIAYAIITGG